MDKKTQPNKEKVAVVKMLRNYQIEENKKLLKNSIVEVTENTAKNMIKKGLATGEF